MEDYTQPRKAENKVELGNEKSNGAETMHPDAYEQGRKSDSPEAGKSFTVGHEEETFEADSNLFGQGRTHLTKEKPGWSDPK